MVEGGVTTSVEERARRSLGASSDAVYRMVSLALAEVRAGGTLVDLGCGSGRVLPFLASQVSTYIGVDVIRYDDFPEDVEFRQLDLDTGTAALPDATADIVTAIETIEHLENPRALIRELTRLAKPGGWVVVTTPNNRSLLSLASLVLKGHFNAFLGESYPAHITALVELDLRRMFGECGLGEVRVRFSLDGRIPGSGRAFPRLVAKMFPGGVSNTILIMGRKP